MSRIHLRIASSILAATAMLMASSPLAIASKSPGAVIETGVTTSAGPGDLDPTFGAGGKVTVPLGDIDGGSYVALAADGENYVVAASVDAGPGEQIVVKRFTSTGALDTGFETTSVNPWDRAAAIVVDHGNTLLVGETGAYAHDSASNFLVQRYLPSGSLDPTFGTGGVVETDIDAVHNDSAIAVALQADGKIVVAGSGRQGEIGNSLYVWVVARYLPSGLLDPEFGGGEGYLTLSAAGSKAELMPYDLGLGLQPDGKIVLGGIAAPDRGDHGTASLAVARVTSDGAADAEFDEDGVVLTTIPDQEMVDGALAVQSDGKIVIAGSMGDGFVTARYTAGGAPDPGFGVNGVTVTATGAPTYLGGIALEGAIDAGQDPSVVLVGEVGEDFSVARYRHDGVLDASFGEEGLVSTEFGAFSSAEDVIATADGKLVVAGWTMGSGAPDAWALARYHGAGDNEPDPCVDQTIAFGEIEAAGCFTHPESTVWEASGTVRMNGIDLAPEGTITFDAGEATLSVEGRVEVSVGDGDNRMVIFVDTGIEWDLSLELTLALPEGFQLKGFPVEGHATLTWSGGDAELELEVGLPELLGGVKAGGTLSANIKEGLKLASLSVEVGEAPLGPRLTLKELAIKYDFEEDTWSGEGKVVLPSEVEVGAKFAFTHGQFASGKAEVGNLNRFIGNGVFLQSIRFGVVADPFTLEGGASITAGPKVMDKAAATLDGDLSYTFADPDIFKVSGKLKVVDLDLAEGSIEYVIPDKVNLAGKLEFSRLGLTVAGDLEGWIDGDRAFNIEGSATVGVDDWGAIGAKAVVSSVGMAACGFVDTWFGQASVGVGYKWGTDPDFGTGCDLGPYTEQQLRMNEVGGYRVGENLPVAAFAVTGESAPPAFTLVGPDGERVDAGEEGSTADHLVVHNPATNTTYVLLASPAAGDWTIEAQKGSSPVTSVRRSDGLPKAEVDGSVRMLPSPQCLGCPEEAVLEWNVKQIEGQNVTFAQVGAETSRVIGVADDRAGSIRFTPGPGKVGERTIVASVEQDGLPRTNVVVATY